MFFLTRVFICFVISLCVFVISLCVFVHFLLFVSSLIVTTSASNCLERLVSGMTYYASRMM